MELNVSKKIITSELVTIAVIFSTLIPYILISMRFSPPHLLHYLFITMVVLTPIGILSGFAFTARWECRPLEMLAFYLSRGLDPPDTVTAAARIRALNLPLLHAASVLVRYEIVTLMVCLYMGTFAGLPGGETVRLGLYAAVGLAFFPILSFFLTERLLEPVRRLLADRSQLASAEASRVIVINTRTRVLSILLATVMAPLFAVGALVQSRVGADPGAALGGPAAIPLLPLITVVIVVAFVLTLAIGILLATSISDPLGRLVRAIHGIEQGDFGVRAHILANDEIGLLSRTFDNMAREIGKGRQELEELNRSLELRVAEKTENLTRAYLHLQLSNQNLEAVNRELEVANRKLREMDQVKSDFISTVSHELRTPLTAIKAFTELVLMKPNMTPYRREKLLTVVIAESDRLTRLIRDILDLTRIEAGTVRWYSTPVSLPEIIRSSVDGIRPLADNKSLSLTLDVPPSLPDVIGDRDRLMQVFTNILSNAIKFTPKGGAITIGAERSETPPRRIVARISDTGIGIPASDIEIIFEKFHRSGDVLTSSIEGTGLGLAIARQIVEHHGGRIWAESAPDRGSTFFISLPLDASPVSAEPRQKPASGS